MKKSLISILVAIFVISMFSIVYAASGSINLGASSETVKVGESFTIAVVGTADNNITALQANLSYDKTKLSIENKTLGNGFADFSGDDEIAIAASNSDSLSKTATLYTLTFKVLDSADAGETTVDLKDISFAVVNDEGKQETVSVEDDGVTITIENANEDNKGNNNANTNNTDNNNTNTNSNSSNDTKLPQTGIEDVNVLLIAVLAVIAIVSYVSYRKYRNI